MKSSRSSNPASVVVIVLTAGTFALALFLKGFTHDLLLEAGVLLVSAKLVLMAKSNAETEYRMEQRLAEIKELLEGLTGQSKGAPHAEG